MIDWNVFDAFLSYFSVVLFMTNVTLYVTFM